MITSFSQFISGAIMMGFFISGFFFLRFWQKTRDGFFLMFAFAFALMGIERIPLAFMNPDLEVFTYVYLFRLSGFILILTAIIYKNKK